MKENLLLAKLLAFSALMLLGVSVKANIFFVKTNGSSAWANISGGTVYPLGTDNVFAIDGSSHLATDTYYFAPGTYYINATLTLTTGQIYGGFSGNESSVSDLSSRVTSDLDGNGIVEPWEFTNVVTFTTSLANGNYSGTGVGSRFITVTGSGGDVNGITLYDFNLNLAGGGAIILGEATSSPADGLNAAKAGKLTQCIVRQFKLQTSNGAIMMNNTSSVIDKCLIEDCRLVNGNGTVYMNKYGGKVSNSVIRNNIVLLVSANTGRGGGIYFGGTDGTTVTDATVSNCAVYNNTASSNGGGIRGDANGITLKGIQIVNCTVVNNSTTTGTTAGSIEVISNGVVANTLSLSDYGSEIRASATSHYVVSTVYGASTGSTIWPATNCTAGIADNTFSAVYFKNPTTFQGAVGNSTTDVGTYTDALKSQIKKANYSITSASSNAVTTTTASLPTTYTSKSGASGYVNIPISATVPTTDIIGRSGINLGAYKYDATAPTVTITTTSSTPKSTFTATITFSEAVSGFSLSKINVGNGTASNFNATSTTVYTVSITPTAEGIVTIDVPANAAISSANSKPNVAATQLSVNYDVTAPTVTITSSASSPTPTSPIPVTFTFSEDVTGFDATDITVGNGAITSNSFTVSSAKVYTATITPTSDGTVTVDIAAAKAVDIAANANTAATQFTITYQAATTAPVGVATAAINPIGSGTATSGVSYTNTGGSAILASGVMWYTTSTNSPDVTSIPSNNKTTDGTGAITGLTHNTTYYVRAYATNAIGTTYGSELSFTSKWAITASAGTADGTVAGGGDYANSATVTLTATATASGKRFMNWTVSGAVVSINTTYTFSATSDKTVVANFADVKTIYYVRPSGSSAWGSIGASADQIITATDAANNFNLAYLANNTPDGTATYYMAAGNYTMPIGTTIVAGGKIYGGFSGSESSVDLNARATSDIGGNGITEPWELSNATVISAASNNYAGSSAASRFIVVSGTGAEVNGVTLTDFFTSYSGAITLGDAAATAAGTPGSITNNEGKLTRCIVRKIKSSQGALMLTNPASIADQCLIEDNYSTASGTGGGGGVYFNRFGGILSNSVIRNNYATNNGGGIYAANSAAGTDLKSVVKNCVVYNNTAGYYGGAIRGEAYAATTSGIEVVNSTVVNNNTGAGGVASMEFVNNGLLVNSIVTNSDARSSIRPNTTSNYCASVAYGTNGGTTLWPATNMVSGKVYTDFSFVSPTTISGYVGIVASDANYIAVHAANFRINSASSVAVTTNSVSSIPATYQVSGTGSTINTYSSVPTTDITGTSRSGDATLGAYQISANTWTGTTSTDWSVASNWSLGVPAANTSAIINSSSNNPAITSNTTCKNLTINSGAVLNVNAGKQLTVTTTLNNSGTLNLLSTNTDGTATILTPATLGGTGGTYNVQQYLTSGRNWYISCPVASAQSSVFGAVSSSTNKLYYYNETQGSSATLNWPQITDNTSSLTVVRGYIANMPADGVVTFTGGALNTGNITTGVNGVPTLTRTAGQTKEGFNLVGNPYPSYLDWMAAIDVTNTGTSNLMTTMWYRTQNPGQPTSDPVVAPYYVFDTYNETAGIGTSNNGTAVTQYIPPMQAFWVRVKPANDLSSTTGTLALTNAMRSHESGTNRMKVRSLVLCSQQVLRLQVSNGINSDEAIVLFNSAASNGYDDYDSPKMSNANAAIPEIYTVAGNEKLVINGLNSINSTSEIPLGFYTGTNNTFTLKATEIRNFDSDTKVLLKDKLLNVERELALDSSYQFSSDIVNSTSRFSLIFRSAGGVNKMESLSDDASVLIYVNANNNIVIKSLSTLQGETGIIVSNLVGQELLKKQLTAANTVLSESFPAGIYMVTFTNAGKNITKKVIVN